MNIGVCVPLPLDRLHLVCSSRSAWVPPCERGMEWSASSCWVLYIGWPQWAQGVPSMWLRSRLARRFWCDHPRPRWVVVAKVCPLVFQGFDQVPSCVILGQNCAIDSSCRCG